ncbi:hypothetical protein Sjap_004893 [Stephania japonica]|uniref:Uncharacterized protein n=1 Tax=Stephania japonica TaxID=461633 RepID=A0AAP0K5F3_9MAGN
MRSSLDCHSFPCPFRRIRCTDRRWYNADYLQGMRSSLDRGLPLPPQPDGILINGAGPRQITFYFQPDLGLGYDEFGGDFHGPIFLWVH